MDASRSVSCSSGVEVLSEKQSLVGWSSIPVEPSRMNLTDGLSPLTHLTESLKDLQTNSCLQSTRRHLPLDVDISTPTHCSRGLLSNKEDMTSTQGDDSVDGSPHSEYDDSPFLQQKCSVGRQNPQMTNQMMKIRQFSTSQIRIPKLCLDSSPPVARVRESLLKEISTKTSRLSKISDQTNKTPLFADSVSCRNNRALSDETNNPRFLKRNSAICLLRNGSNKAPRERQKTHLPAGTGKERRSRDVFGAWHLVLSPTPEQDEEEHPNRRNLFKRRRLLPPENQENVHPSAVFGKLMKERKEVVEKSCSRVVNSRDAIIPIKKICTIGDCSAKPSGSVKTDIVPKAQLAAKIKEQPLKKETPTKLFSVESMSCLTVKAETETSRSPRSHSVTEVMIKSALNRADEQQNLIGDFSHPYQLPLVQSKHDDLNAISADTMASLLVGDLKNTIGPFTIVDCRYPYEYEGGHIKGSLNMFTKDQIVSHFLTSQQQQQHESAPSQKNPILIFHCEFSSERGPKMMHFLRNRDRDLHRDSYPTLFFPEMYLLEGGYKAFFELHKTLCEPDCYKPMIHGDHAADLRHFRSKAKTWSALGTDRDQTNPRLSRQMSNANELNARLIRRKLH